jgi:periplasmic copper chaperone A
MHPIARIDVAAGATVKLQPGGMHLMITGPTRSLHVGDRLELDLVFERAGTIVVSAEIREG